MKKNGIKLMVGILALFVPSLYTQSVNKKRD